MKVLKLGSVGPSVELLQLALGRAGARSLAPDGIFGNATKAALRTFQSDNGLAADGVAGPATHRALMPYYTGFASHRIHRGDTLFALSQLYNVPLSAILTANPGIAPEKLAVGSSVVIPLPFDIVPTNVSFTSTLVSFCVRGIAARYPFVKAGRLGRSVMGTPLWYLSIGEGEKSVFYNAAHHANEWITVPLLLSFAEKLARAYAEGGKIFGRSAKEMDHSAALSKAPCVGADGRRCAERAMRPQHSVPVGLEGEYPRHGSKSAISGRVGAGAGEQIRSRRCRPGACRLCRLVSAVRGGEPRDV